MGGEITTAAPTGIADTDVVRLQLFQEPVAEPFSLIADVEKDSTEAQTEEKNSQEQYEEFMGESSASRADKVKEIGGLNDSKATLESSSAATNVELQSAQASVAAASKVLASLHQESDWLVQNFDTRKAARVGEVDSLNNAKAF